MSASFINTSEDTLLAFVGEVTSSGERMRQRFEIKEKMVMQREMAVLQGTSYSRYSPTKFVCDLGQDFK